MKDWNGYNKSAHQVLLRWHLQYGTHDLTVRVEKKIRAAERLGYHLRKE